MASAAGKFNFDETAATVDLSAQFPFTEPLIVTAPHVDGFMAHAEAGSMHFAGWQMIRPLSDGPGERRIVVRFAMSEFEARAFRYVINTALREGH